MEPQAWLRCLTGNAGSGERPRHNMHNTQREQLDIGNATQVTQHRQRNTNTGLHKTNNTDRCKPFGKRAQHDTKTVSVRGEEQRNFEARRGPGGRL